MSNEILDMEDRDTWAREENISDRERGYRLMENAYDRIVNEYVKTNNVELMKATSDMTAAFFLLFKEKTIEL